MSDPTNPAARLITADAKRIAASLTREAALRGLAVILGVEEHEVAKKRKKADPAETIEVEPTQIVALPLQLHIEIEGGVLQDVSVHDAKGSPVEFVYTLDDKDVDGDGSEEDDDDEPGKSGGQ